MISQQTIKDILDAARIEEVIGEYVSLKKAGVNFKGLSPFTQEKTPSFIVSPAKQIFKCFSTGKGGNVVSFLMEHDQMSYPEALKNLARRYNIEIEEKEETEEDRQQKNKRESLAVVLKYAGKNFIEQLKESDEGKAIGLSYFKERDLGLNAINKFELGYTKNQFDFFTNNAIKKGYSKEMLLQSGLAKEKNGKVFDFFRGRVIFPIHSVSGQVIAFAGRILKDEKNAPKYINSPETDLYNKSKILYGIFQAKQAIIKQDMCYLVEGYTDVISLHEVGIENVVASSGTALTKEQIRLIKRYTNNVTVLYDGDPAGIRASLRGVDLLLEQEMNIRVVLFPEGEDPDSFARANGNEKTTAFLQEKATNFITFKAKTLLANIGDDPIKRAEVLKDIAVSLALIPDHIKRSLLVKATAEQMNLEEAVVLQEVNRIRRKNYREQLKKTTTPEQELEAVLPELSPDKKVPPAPKHLDTTHQEKEILRLMILYGTEQFTMHNLDENGDVITSDHNVLEFILDTIEGDEIKFENHDYQLLLDLLLEKRNPEVNFLTSLLPPDKSHLITDIIHESHVISENWDKKHEIITYNEKDKLERAIIQTLYSFLLKKVETEIGIIQTAIKHCEDVDQSMEHLSEQMKYEKAKLLFSKELNRVILK